jgi:uncharacterized protein HemX
MDSELLQYIVTGVMGFGALGGLIWAWIQKQRANLSDTRAAIAEDNRDRELANSAHTLYSLLNERLKNVEREVVELKVYNRKLEIHVARLEDIMVKNGLEPPVFVP